MNERYLLEIKNKRNQNLKYGAIFLLVGFIIFPALAVSAYWFYKAYSANKEYKEKYNEIMTSLIEKEKEAERKAEQEAKEKIVNVIDLEGNNIEVETCMMIAGDEDVLITEGGRTFHTSFGCFKNWKPEMQTNFTGWKIIKRKEALLMGMKYCAFCEEASKVTIDDLLDDLESEELDGFGEDLD